MNNKVQFGLLLVTLLLPSALMASNVPLDSDGDSISDEAERENGTSPLVADVPKLQFTIAIVLRSTFKVKPSPLKYLIPYQRQ